MPKPVCPDQQRRYFHRVLFNAAAQLAVDTTTLSCEVLDLSLKGALVQFAEGGASAICSALRVGSPCRLELKLTDEVQIAMDAEVAHQNGGRAGLHCLSIDLDSVSHLRRLVELNVGNDALLQRQLSSLAAFT